MLRCWHVHSSSCRRPSSRASHPANPDAQYASQGSTFPLNGKDACAVATDDWYSEVSSYNFATPASGAGLSIDGGATGHFTLAVWSGTTQMGCAVATCPGAATSPFPDKTKPWVFVVCQYTPPGNVVGQFPANVKRSACVPAWGVKAARQGLPGCQCRACPAAEGTSGPLHRCSPAPRPSALPFAGARRPLATTGARHAPEPPAPPALHAGQGPPTQTPSPWLAARWVLPGPCGLAEGQTCIGLVAAGTGGGFGAACHRRAHHNLSNAAAAHPAAVHHHLRPRQDHLLRQPLPANWRVRPRCRCWRRVRVGLQRGQCDGAIPSLGPVQRLSSFLGGPADAFSSPFLFVHVLFVNVLTWPVCGRRLIFCVRVRRMMVWHHHACRDGA